jgi:exodeoxyribonuclease V beta subunit
LGDSAKTALNYLIKKDKRGINFIEDKKLPVGNEPPDFNSVQVFPVDVSELEHSSREPIKYQPSIGDALEFKAFKLGENFEVPKNWGIVSYSSLVQHKGFHPIITNVGGGKDETDTASKALEIQEKEIAEVPRLPGGNKTGSCFHEIMEEIDFKLVRGESHAKWSETPSIRGLLEGKMRKYGLIRGKRSGKETADSLLVERYPLLCRIIHQTLTAQIPAPCGGKTFSLNEIEKPDRISEMEFFYEIKGKIDRAKLKKIANSLLPKTAAPGENEQELKDGKINTGFMNGSIDIVFRKDGRYCFADWKTNTLEDYDQSSMWNKMFNDSYILQHLIYSLTLDLYLQKRLDNYVFEKHFGGGYYLFVRGLEPNGEKGILANRVGQDVLVQLKNCIYNSIGKNDEVAQ